MKITTTIILLRSIHFFSLGSQVSLVSTDQVGDFCVVIFPLSLSLSLSPSLLLLFLYFHWFTYRLFLSSSVALLLPLPLAFFLRVLSPLIAGSIRLPFPILKGRESHDLRRAISISTSTFNIALSKPVIRSNIVA